MGNIWDVLGIGQTTNQEQIKVAFAEKLKQYHPEDDPEGFKALQQAYKKAMAEAKGSRNRSTRQQRQSEQFEEQRTVWETYEETKPETAYDFSGLDGDDTELSHDEELSSQETVYDFSDIEPDNQQREETTGSSFDETFQDWKVDFDDDDDVSESWDDMAEQFREAEAVETLLDELCARLGVLFTFEQFNQLLAVYHDHPLFQKESVKRGLEAHCLNAFVVGTWKARSLVVERCEKLGMSMLASYLQRIGLSEQALKLKKDTTLEGWEKG
ncbi:J domain-containing protein [Streptococcus sp. S784/96/1]|uniref:J domain-containing protein n=1 Tax=Streptococcus sp. S784/96/1 TaxID=2653499 RepID=UPI00138968CC|nr:J domain-containing protein [Streptococcus sp. S784/96/1]